MEPRSMPQCTPCPAERPADAVEIDAFEDVHVDAFEHAAPLPTASQPSDGSVHVYPHGFSVRVELTGSHELPSIVFGEGWKGSTTRNGIRFVLRGSAWLAHRKPQGTKTPMARFNRANRTQLYSIAFETVDTAVEDRPRVFVDLQGVRYTDVARVMEQALRLEQTAYAIQHFRIAERYIVLTPADAGKLAAAVNARAVAGRGRVSRKSWGVKDHVIAVTVRRRTRVNAILNVYRILRGATWVYKCEVALKGRTRD